MTPYNDRTSTTHTKISIDTLRAIEAYSFRGREGEKHDGEAPDCNDEGNNEGTGCTRPARSSLSQLEAKYTQSAAAEKRAEGLLVLVFSGNRGMVQTGLQILKRREHPHMPVLPVTPHLRMLSPPKFKG
jgi:hypothetical protein